MRLKGAKRFCFLLQLILSNLENVQPWVTFHSMTFFGAITAAIPMATAGMMGSAAKGVVAKYV